MAVQFPQQTRDLPVLVVALVLDRVGERKIGFAHVIGGQVNAAGHTEALVAHAWALCLDATQKGLPPQLIHFLVEDYNPAGEPLTVPMKEDLELLGFAKHVAASLKMNSITAKPSMRKIAFERARDQLLPKGAPMATINALAHAYAYHDRISILGSANGRSLVDLGGNPLASPPAQAETENEEPAPDPVPPGEIENG